jgi:hypothetical protein
VLKHLRKFNNGRWAYSKTTEEVLNHSSDLNNRESSDTQPSSVKSLAASISDSEIIEKTLKIGNLIAI